MLLTTILSYVVCVIVLVVVGALLYGSVHYLRQRLSLAGPPPPPPPHTHTSWQVLIDRKKWIDLAEECEKADAPLTCASIIRAVIGLGVEKEDRKRTWLADAEVGTLVPQATSLSSLHMPLSPALYMCSCTPPQAHLHVYRTWCSHRELGVVCVMGGLIVEGHPPTHVPLPPPCPYTPCPSPVTLSLVHRCPLSRTHPLTHTVPEPTPAPLLLAHAAPEPDASWGGGGCPRCVQAHAAALSQEEVHLAEGGPLGKAERHTRSPGRHPARGGVQLPRGTLVPWPL